LQSDAGEWLDRQNTAVEPVLFPGIATRAYLLPNLPDDRNILASTSAHYFANYRLNALAW